MAIAPTCARLGVLTADPPSSVGGDGSIPKFDHHGLAELGGEMPAEDARHQVAVGARRQRHDDADRAGGVGLRGGGDARNQ